VPTITILKGILVVSFILFMLCCVLSVWLSSLIGYVITISTLLTATLIFLVINVIDGSELSAKSLFTSITILLFFAYIVTAKYMMKAKFFSAITPEEFRRYLIEHKKNRLPYTLVVFVPRLIVILVVGYIFSVLIPGNFEL